MWDVSVPVSISWIPSRLVRSQRLMFQLKVEGISFCIKRYLFMHVYSKIICWTHTILFVFAFRKHTWISIQQIKCCNWWFERSSKVSLSDNLQAFFVIALIYPENWSLACFSPGFIKCILTGATFICWSWFCRYVFYAHATWVQCRLQEEFCSVSICFRLFNFDSAW